MKIEYSRDDLRALLDAHVRSLFTMPADTELTIEIAGYASEAASVTIEKKEATNE